MRILAIIISSLYLTGCIPSEPTPSVVALTKFNTRVNNTLHYKADVTDHWQTPLETWTLKHGDCEDYAILKQALLQLGAVYLVYLPGVKPNPYHAVLIVDTYVLDNRYDAIQNISSYFIVAKLDTLRRR